MKKKVLVSAGALALAVGVTAAGTLAYLSSETNKVTNTFTYSSEEQDVSLTLKEYGVKADGLTVDKGTVLDTSDGAKQQEYTIVPGAEAQKEPFLVLDTQNPSYVYAEVVVTQENGVKGAIIDEAALNQDILDEGWKLMDGVDNGVYGGKVYYKEAAMTSASENAAEITIFDTVKYSNVEVDDSTEASIEVYGYAIAQQGMGSVTEAWNTAKGDFNK